MVALELSGEIDFEAAKDLAARLDEQLEGDGDVVLDMRAVSFIDVAGCRVLVHSAGSLPAGRRLVLSHPPKPVIRVLGLCEWLDQPNLVIQTDFGGVGA